MLGKLKKLFSASAAGQQEMRLEEAGQFMQARLGKEIMIAREKLDSEIRNVMAEYSQLRRLYAELDSRDATSDFPNSVKARLCRRAVQLLAAEEPEADYGSVMEFLKASQESLKNIGSFGYKEMIHLYAFREEMNRIASQTKALISALNSLAAETEKSLLKEVSRAEKCMEGIEASKAMREGLASAIEKLEDGIKEKTELLEEKVKSLKEFSSTEEEINGLKEEIDKAAAEMDFLESKISEEFTGTEKLFRKYRHLKKGKGMLDEYLKNATGAFLFLDKELEIRSILDDMAEKKERLEDDRRFGKLLQLRRDIEMLASLRDEFLSLKKSKEEKEEELLKLSSRASDKEYRLKDIDGIESEMRSMEKEKSGKENEIKAAEERVKFDMQRLASLLGSLTGENVRVQ